MPANATIPNLLGIILIFSELNLFHLDHLWKSNQPTRLFEMPLVPDSVAESQFGKFLQQETSRCRPCETHDERWPHVQDSHRHGRFTNKNRTRENSVSREFGTVQGTSSGLASVEGNPFLWPHENLHRSGDLNDDESPMEATSSCLTTSQPTTSQRSTTSAKKFRT